VNVLTNITHTFNSDIDMTLTSPAGTVVTLTTDNGSSFDNVFNGTTWDDDANPGGQVPYTSNEGLVTDTTYADLVVETPLTPEEALAAFVGENPNGTWTLTISDDAGGDGGAFTWALDLTTLTTAPTTATTMGANNTPVTIPSTGTPVVTSTIVIAGAGTSILDVNALTNITHTFNSDLDVTLTSPAGTVVTLTTDNGSSFDNVFNGTTWDDDADPDTQVPYTANQNEVTEHTYVDLTPVPTLLPEEPLGAFIGENPNGTWTLTISDDAGGDGGAFTWGLTITTAMCAVVQGCQVICPPAQNVTATSPTGAVVNYPAPTTTGNCGVVTCAPASGTLFPVGTTNVTCTEIASSTTTTTTYSSGNVAVPIPATGTSGMMTPQTITVPDAGTVTDVNLGIRLDHTFDADLEITLVAPNGTTSVLVMDDNGSGGDNLGSGSADCAGTKTVFDQQAQTSIADGTAPFDGSFIPLNSLATFNGTPAAGTWTLRINDDAGGDVGTLFCWELQITRNASVAGATCTFPVTVSIPFDGCCVDDASGDTFRSVVAGATPGSALYGFWEYHVAATGETFTGTANYIAYRPGLSLVMRDTDDVHVAMYAQIDYIRKTCLVQVTDRTTGRTFTLRDRNTANSTCGAPQM